MHVSPRRKASRLWLVTLIHVARSCRICRALSGLQQAKEHMATTWRVRARGDECIIGAAAPDYTQGEEEEALLQCESVCGASSVPGWCSAHVAHDGAPR